ncbi:hypothetical protein L1987_06318 [Smallanthus sonchifolius]|uniref:Uncharacterized protein n=1 Tax=Smallanthus sonchifolius TaxID=185202 RepID=A0ACB9JXT6_9ASTR|nr:hypothetical protein L1987_06318 [Smallanthus sonchifolius]
MDLVITPVIQSLIVPFKKHLHFLVSSTRYVNEMKKKMEELNVTEQDILEKKSTADANNHEVSHHVSPCLEDVKKMNEKAQSIPTRGIGCFNVTKRYKTRKRSYTILNEIKALNERLSEINWTNEQKSLAKVPSTSSPFPS